MENRRTCARCEENANAYSKGIKNLRPEGRDEKGVIISTTATPTAKNPFHQRFRLDTQLVPGEDAFARPAIFAAFDLETNQNVIVKRWPRNATGDPDLEIIWRNEVRLLQALSAYPGGREYLMPLVESEQDSRHFVLALGAGSRRPLSLTTVSVITGDDSARLLLWKNIRRLIKGLAILHAHGLVHRNVGPHAVFTNHAAVPDFQLSGFEWSVRLRAPSATRTTRPEEKSEDSRTDCVSFTADWQALGGLVASLFGMGWRNSSDYPRFQRARIQSSSSRTTASATTTP